MLAAFAVVLLAPMQAQASFSRASSGTVSASSDTLAPSGAVTVNNSQCGIVILTQAALHVMWTATSSTYATGYVVTPVIAGVAQTPTTVSGRSTASVDLDVVRGTVYTFQVRAAYRNWTSLPMTSPSFNCNVILG